MSKHHGSPGLNRCAHILFIAFFVVISLVLSVPAASPQTPAGADGTLDATFGVGGKVRSDFLDQKDWLSAFALQADGKMIVAGKLSNKLGGSSTDDPIVLMRYNSDGSLDPSFGSGGKFIGAVGNIQGFRAIVPLPNGKILLGGIAYIRGARFGLARFNSDGSLDTSFGSAGTVVTAAADISAGLSLLVQPDGKILLAGFGGPHYTQTSAFIVARYDDSGNLDQSFGEHGLARISFSKSHDVVAGCALQPDGKIVVAGTRGYNLPDRSFALTRLNRDGSIDGTFGSGGKVATDFGGQPCDALAMALQPDGKIIVAGRSTKAEYMHEILVMARYNQDGSLDKGFGNGGKVSDDFFGRGGHGCCLALQRDGKIIVGGVAHVTRAGYRRFVFAVLRYKQDGSLDPSFNGDGITTTHMSEAEAEDDARAMAIQPDGKIILAGISRYENSRSDIVLARYNGTSSH